MVSILSADMASDSDLVLRYVGGDQDALGEIYRRYSDRVYDLCMAMLHSPDDAADAFQDTFLIAARRLNGLRKPERLRPWLYSVARNQCRARIRARKRTTPDEDAGVNVGIEIDMTAQLASAELTQLVTEAQAGLTRRDQEVLDLHMRHGLEGEDLAEVLGVSVQSAYKLVQRVRNRVEKSLGAILIARHGRKDCPDLDQLLSDWDGRFSPLIRKQVSRHVDDCDVCSRRRKALLDPSGMASAMPFTPAPSAVQHAVLTSLLAGTSSRVLAEPKWRGDGFPAKSRRVGRRLSGLAFAGVIATMVLIGGALGVVGAATLGDDSPPSDTATTSTVSGSTSSTVADPTTTLPPPATSPALPATSAVTTTAIPTTTAMPTTTIAPTPIAPTTVVPTTTAAITSTTTVTTTTTSAPDTSPPVFGQNMFTDAGVIQEQFTLTTCKYPTSANLTAEVTDNVGVAIVSGAWQVGTTPYSVPFSLGIDGFWHAVLGPFPKGTTSNGEQITVNLVASDIAGNSTTTQMSRPIQLVPCGN